MQRMQVMPGVMLTAVQTKKFKTSYHSLQFLTPLREDSAALNALVPRVLRRGCMEHPDLRSLAVELESLYGGAIEPTVRKRGEVQCVGFAASFVDDACAGMDLTGDAARLMGELLLRPATRNGRFYAEYVASERENLISDIRGEVNDKRAYAQRRMIEHMCADEAFRLSRLGTVEEAERCTPARVYAQYQHLLQAGLLELYYCGATPPEQVRMAWRTALAGLPRFGQYDLPETALVRAPEQPAREIVETMDVTQGKLVMGFRTGCTCVSFDYPALMVLNALFGGTTTSKLFLNVREKHSLCYYANSSLDKLKGLLFVSCGVDAANYPVAKQEILAQLDACKAGEFTDAELESARASVVHGLRSAMDAQGRMEEFWLGQAAAGVDTDPLQMADLVLRVDKLGIMDAAQRLRLDTVYFLKGGEA